MTCPPRRLLTAFAISIGLHALPFIPPLPASKPPPAAPLSVRLKPPAAPPDEAPPLILPEPTPPETPQKPVAKHPEKPPSSARGWNEAMRKQLRQIKTAGLLYSQEAFDLKLEGTPVVLFILDEAGNVSGARIQEGSGHAILDRDAVRAVYRIKSLPSDAPREILLPLQFRLKD